MNKVYIACKDTFGDGLVTASGGYTLDVVYTQEELDNLILELCQDLQDEAEMETGERFDENPNIIDFSSVCIFESVEKIDGFSTEDYVKNLFQENLKKTRKSEYEEYLRLKKKFENVP